ncbi:MAG TPA: hypothetical protein VLF62_01325 [Candidatus Saccharimonadales bacterium]|nr:hypothetical protein [Candidatus Saccharimonadales bacterium]
MSLLLAATPASANYTLKAYELGGGAGSGSSTNYGLRGGAGGINGKLTSANYALPAGVQASRTAPVPAAPTLANQNSSYNKLHLTLNNNGFAADTKFLIAISTDDFATTNYIQLDNTVGATVSVANYQTYAAWGSSSGFDIVGLNGGLTYKVKVAALQGSATGSSFGPTASAATLTPSATFALQTSLTATPPFGVSFTSLPAGAVTAGNATITGTVSTNASGGGNFVITDSNSGLTSPSKSFTLASASTDLSVAGSGYGARVSGTSQASGAVMASASPFNGSSNNVGALSGSQQAFTTWTGPVTTGTATLSLLAKSTTLTPASTDYADVITISLSLLF